MTGKNTCPNSRESENQFARTPVSASTGVDDHEPIETRAVEALVACQQPVSLQESVCPNKEIRCHPRPRATTLPVSLPGNSGFERGFRVDRTELDTDFLEDFNAGRNRGKEPRYFSPHHVAGEQTSLRGAGPQTVTGCNPELGIAIQEIKQNVAVNRGDHFSGYSPRSSFMISSVRRPSFKTPKYLSNGSLGIRLLITKRPRSSRTSSTCPVRRPSRTRSGFGMVICPFSETTVFIPRLYEFLPSLSSRKGTACRPRISTGPNEGRASPTPTRHGRRWFADC